MLEDKYIGIIGAGPAGSFSALLLRKLGFQVTVIEKRAKLTRKICGEKMNQNRF